MALSNRITFKNLGFKPKSKEGVKNKGGIKNENENPPHTPSFYISPNNFKKYNNKEISIQAHKLKSARLVKGYTQNELSRITYVSVDTIRAWEQGKRDITKASLATLTPIANALSISIDDLISVKEE